MIVQWCPACGQDTAHGPLYYLIRHDRVTVDEVAKVVRRAIGRLDITEERMFTRAVAAEIMQWIEAGGCDVP